MSDNDSTPKWLIELQQKSWEPEILLSGIVLYGMFKMPELLDQGLLYFKTNIYGGLNDVDNLVAVLKIAVYWLIGGLVLHLISRGIWIGMVGLSYTFPNGVNQTKLNYYGKFESKIKNIPSFQTIIINLEKICSSLFSISFMMFMIMIGGYLYLLILLVLPFFALVFITNSYESTFIEIFGIYALLVLLIGIVGIIDFVTVGFFRRFKWFSIIFWPFHRMISVLTLSRQYRGIYYGLVSNVNKWYIFIFLLIFIIVNINLIDKATSSAYSGVSFSRITFWNNTAGFSAFSGYYDDQNEDIYSVRASIPSDIIDENTLRLFIVANIDLEDSIRAYSTKSHIKQKLDSLDGREKNFHLVKSFYKVYINDSLIDEYPMKFHFKSHTKQMGYLVYLDISDLATGMYEVRVSGPREMYPKGYFSSIPFYREKRKFPTYSTPSIDEKSNEGNVRSVKPFIVE